MGMLGQDYLYAVVTGQRQGGVTGLVKGLLWSLSGVYRLILRLRRLAYARKVFAVHDLGRPVISVGNITVGGVGKTPLVRLLAAHIRDQGRRPAVLTRGYMPGAAPAGQPAVSDEAEMLRGQLGDVPVVANPDRVAGAQALLTRRPVDVFLLDDGFQHWRIRRDLDIVAVDAVNPFGHGLVLPRGILREPLAALGRADVFVLTKTDLAPEGISTLRAALTRRNPDALIVESVHAPRSFSDLLTGEVYDLAEIRGRAVHLVSSLGDPDSFEKTLAPLGPEIRGRSFFRDHHPYTSEDITRILAACERQGVDLVITTAKDAVKLRAFAAQWGRVKVWVLEIGVEMLKGREEFLARINRLL